MRAEFASAQLPDRFKLDYLLFSLCGENYTEREIKKLTVKELILRKCLMDHRAYVNNQANKPDNNDG